jgi:TonB family protein
VSVNKHDIEQIRKYLNGELDERAMFELERRTQADPLLWDMLKGMESDNISHQNNLDEIDRLIDKRVEKDKKRIIPLWTIVSVAASLLIVLGIGGWLLTRQTEKPAITLNHVKKAPLTAKSKNTDSLVVVTKPATPLTRQPVIARLKRHKLKELEPAAQTATRPAAALASIGIKTDTVSQRADMYSVKTNFTTDDLLKKTPDLTFGKNGNIIVRGQPATRTKINGKEYNGLLPTKDKNNAYGFKTIDTSLFVRKGELAYNKRDSTRQLKEIAITGYTTVRKRDLTGSVSSIEAKDITKPKDTLNNTLAGRVAGISIDTKKAKAASLARTIKGTVVDKTDNLPLAGVYIRVKDKSIAAATDINGNFSIVVPPNVETLAVTYVGFNMQEVKIKNNTELKIALTPSDKSLAEVVVVGYGATDRSEHVYRDAQPAAGWSSYDKYIKDNATMPDGKTGVVRLAFTVEANGSISNVIVKKSAGAAMDQKAIDLVKNGPKWQGDEDGRPKVKHLRIKFHQ